ncbi:MAG: nicotinate (nicotinamide) nucleotide adenylyltransferase [Ruminococcus flavefaciens]|nr:nicotinate (nicotinamide) nucleotide adenylyltransferase [Ruminococcus flavefaciens]MCM1230567.1 nicotinate (nicotinamide) nucleotide adenylyltransferase [Ruminococcus flavefaciens]
MRIGIYGGSFNPVHNGHIHLALSAVEELGLDRIYLVPSGISPHRSSAEYAPPDDRIEMLRIACGISEKLDVCDYEIKSDRKSYTIYTVEEFRRRFPEDELFLLIGSDMLMIFEQWYRFEEILKEVTLAVVSRSNGDMDMLAKKAEKLRKFGEIIICRAEAVEVSSTEIRKKIVKNENFSCYLDKNVVQYITSNNLYK